MTVPEELGLGIELVDKYVSKYPRRSKGIDVRTTERKADGSLMVATH